MMSYYWQCLKVSCAETCLKMMVSRVSVGLSSSMYLYNNCFEIKTRFVKYCLQIRYLK